MQGISILGSTGSIGTQALRVCGKLGIQPAALAGGGGRLGLLEEQARRWSPAMVAVADEAAARSLRISLADTPVHVAGGREALCEAARRPESGTVLNAVVGMVGLEPTLCALRAGKKVAIANKETLVAAGRLVMREAARSGAALIPVDSEHSAIFQCLRGNDKKDARRILLTASGGPFFGRRRAELSGVSRDDALRHPNWSMGAKITVDSATMMNKGLELIEAMWLFDMPPDAIEVVVQRESVIHSAVEYCDGSVIAQLGVPDMAIPIQYALTYPRRVETGLARAPDLCAIGRLTFYPPDEETFGCLAAAKEAARRGGLAPCILNAANEAAAALFLQGRVGFLQIEELVRGALRDLPAPEYSELDEVLAAEKAAAEYVARRLERL